MKILSKLGFVLITLLIGCSPISQGELEKVGLLVSHTIDDQGWNSKGYEGLLSIHSELDVEIFLKENIETYAETYRAVKEFSEEGVTLIFGHSSLFAEYFMELKDDFPHIHFVSFNGTVDGENITSLHFDGYAMGYFAGMLSSDMTETGNIGVIAAYPHQPEVQGFEDGSYYNNPKVKVKVEYVNSWSNVELASTILDDMIAEDVDIIYPAGDGFHISIMEKIKNEGLFGIGYVSDHIDLGESTVLTSTVQHVEKLYTLIAEKYRAGELEGGNFYFDFADGVISLGTFSKEVPVDIRKKVELAVEGYIETEKLPHEMNK